MLNLSDQLREMNYVKHCKNKVLDVLVQMRLNYETWKGPDGVKIDIRPNGEVIRTQRVPRTDGVQGKYPQRQDYEGNPLPNNHHHSGYFVK
ncbi:hypothetical protein [Neisseria meningitidis]|uniref:hypothetical protein n=1 Tax=Neisseria meningitidis TaxID=487 RepID=UPI001E368B19|nr:hypothetical protein [Neisseria meningitidis]